jgi:hypothetical protein
MPGATRPFLLSSAAYYRQHRTFEAPQVDGVAFRKHWRPRTKHDRLLIDGCISWFEWRITGEPGW